MDIATLEDRNLGTVSGLGGWGADMNKKWGGTTASLHLQPIRERKLYHYNDITRWEDANGNSPKIKAEIVRRGAVPHYSILGHLGLAQQFIRGGDVHIFTDDVGNLIIFGLYECRSDDVRKCSKPSRMRVLYDAGVLFKDISPSIVNKTMVKTDRKTGSGWPGETTKNIFWDKKWMNKMIQRENEGFSPVPYLYFVYDVNPVTFSSVVMDIANVVLASAGMIANFVTGGVVSPIVNAGVSVFTKLVAGVAKDGNITINDLTDAVVASAPILLSEDDVAATLKKNVPIDIKPLQSLVEEGALVYQAAANDDHESVSKLLGIDIRSLAGQFLMADLKSYDTYSITGSAQKRLSDVEKIMQSVQNADMMLNMTTQYDRMSRAAYVEKNALIHHPIQQFLINAQANVQINSMTDELKGFIAGFPNALGAVKMIVQNNDMNVQEFNALLNIITNRDIGKNDLDRLTTDALMERAKHYKGKKFVLPSNLPNHLIDTVSEKINRELPGVTVINPKKQKYYREFV